MSSASRPVPITDLQELAALARELVEQELERRIPDEPTSQRFHREWNGVWRVRVEIGRPPRGRLDFVLFETPDGALLALPHPMPDAWRADPAVPASDGTRWRWNEDGQVEAAT